VITDKAFEQLFKDNLHSLTLLSLKYVKDLDTAREIVQESFVSLWEKRENLDPERSIPAYIKTMVHNRSLNYLRNNRRLESFGDVLEIHLNLDDNDKNDSLETSELRVRIEDAINALPEKCREIFLLSRNENLKYAEIAERLSISVKTVETQMSRALLHFRKQLKVYLLSLFYGFMLFIQNN
jgi:RNA polymerase sigma-70 factor (ECF subfamily)